MDLLSQHQLIGRCDHLRCLFHCCLMQSSDQHIDQGLIVVIAQAGWQRAAAINKRATERNRSDGCANSVIGINITDNKVARAANCCVGFSYGLCICSVADLGSLIGSIDGDDHLFISRLSFIVSGRDGVSKDQIL